jgi:YD repeat-containing protein
LNRVTAICVKRSKLAAKLLLLACFAGCGNDAQSALGAGGASAGGASAGGVASSAGAGGATSCPPWPLSKLLPLIGPQFYGPDPGPCSIETMHTTDQFVTLDTVEYSSDGTILKISDGDAVETLAYDAQGRPTSLSDTANGLTTYEYGDGFVLRATANGFNFRYNLDGQGYVTTAVVSRASDGGVIGTYRYSYDACRISRVTYTATGGSEEVYYSDIAYDSEGRMTRRAGPTQTMTFDYSCWQ